MNNLFLQEFENQAIERIKKFGLLCEKLNQIPVLGFSGGKDSIVTHDLCKRSGIIFRSCFNHSFESPYTINFIRKNFKDVEFRRVEKKGFFQNIKENHNGMFPTAESALCCDNYKHNHKFTDYATITGIRANESQKRKQRKTLETRTKRFLKKNKNVILSYFTENCIASGAHSEIQLHPIIDWSDEDVWNYIYKYKLPINPEYNIGYKRVGCMICPKANFDRNYLTLLRYPKLIDCAIKSRQNTKNDWFITSDNKDYSDDKVYYICRWLNYSFRPFSKKNEELYKKFRKYYDSKVWQ